MARTIQALRICQQKLKRNKVKRMRLIATEACRRAKNSREFIRQVKRETGLTLEIIQPEEEARLAVISCAPLVSTKTEQLLVVDIGGGSTELVWIDISSVLRAVTVQQQSCACINGFHTSRQPISGREGRGLDQRSPGCRNACAINSTTSKMTAARFALMSWFFEENLADFAPYKDEQTREGFQIVGTSGTVTTVAASHLGLKRYDRTKVDGLRMTSDQIDKVIRGYLELGPHGSAPGSLGLGMTGRP